ncbi:MAG: acyl CoA:acetate/3-ketoacid CoA transferase [Peptococcaceae bacterium]|nr:MAG: acyl CoA:acetate/3-ketoacid CoA transferase [Peptococcaceae bacterium]
MSKVIAADQAGKLVRDGDVVIGDGITFGFPEELFIALEEHFLKTGHPRNLTVIAPGGAGNVRGRGFDHLAHEGLLRKYCTSYLTLTRKIDELICGNKIEGYMLPLGVFAQLLREIAAGRPGLITHVGLKTFVDPRLEGGRLNSLSDSTGFIPEVIALSGKEWLFYKSFPVDVALLCGTTADEDGNISFERQAGVVNATAMAMAAKKCGGRVIAQVERLAGRGALKPQAVKVPGILVDAVVLARPENHKQTFNVQYDPARSGELRAPEVAPAPVPLNCGKIVARRAAMELKRGMVVNIGAGTPEFIPSVAWEEGIQRRITFAIEAGMIGGIPGYGLNFNTATNPDAILDHPYMMDFFDGGGCDATFLGLAQIDRRGNVNVSKLKNRVTGLGGFLNVAGTSKMRFHCGLFTAGEQDIGIENGRLQIVRDGEVCKFVNRVEQISVSGSYALDVGQPVTVITERAVFSWTEQGLTLIEIAPGVDLERDIRARMEFLPLVSPELKEMPAEIFLDGLMGLVRRLG